jgi:hypothetical protein
VVIARLSTVACSAEVKIECGRNITLFARKAEKFSYPEVSLFSCGRESGGEGVAAE